MDILKPIEIIQKIILPHDNFPGNPSYPLLIYKHIFSDMNTTPQTLQTMLNQNNWSHSWIDSIYDFHHDHSNTHEVLVIISGK